MLIPTGSNKRDHLLVYFIISLFICMWALQEVSDLPPDAGGWREATMAAHFLGQGAAPGGSVQGQELDFNGPCGFLSVVFL